MSKWNVTYESRQHGAIGIFEPRTREVEGYSRRDAMLACCEKLNEEGFECRFPISAAIVSDTNSG